MWWAILTRRQEAFKRWIDLKLQEQIKDVLQKRDVKILKIQNKAINKINKLNIEYKYEKATKSMIHDWEKSQAMSMLGALRYVGILA